MKIFMRKIISIAILCAVAVSAIAVPARREGIVRTSSDGTEKTVFQYGDETFHYITDENGVWLDEETLEPLSEEVKSERLKVKGNSRIAKARRAKEDTGTDRLLAPRGAVILVSYSDKAFGQSNEDMTDWAMGDEYTYNGATGSIHQYFYDQSWGQYDMHIDVYGPVTLSKEASYYGKNDWSGNDQHADEMVVEACRLAHDSCGADFSQYDSDGDGKVDWVVILYAGKGEADGGAANTIWPHQYELSYTGKAFQLDGKTVDHYCCLNEIDGQTGERCGIGTFCHEFSHVMGLPDFYSTNQGSHRTLGSWDIMDYGPYNNGGNTPPNYSAYERWFMGWIEPTLLNTDCSVTLPPLQDSKAACLITESGQGISNILLPLPATFFLIENRQQEGWDTYLKGSGMMVTKVQWNKSKWANNTVNNTSTKLGVDIIEAKANTSSYLDKATDLYPKGNTECLRTEPFFLYNIAMSNRIITFDVNEGGNMIVLEVESVQHSELSVRKVIENGQVIIIREGQKFDILGNRL